MLSHYLKIAFRNLRKHWIQSLTGILGIAFAIACLVPSIYWVDYETSYVAFIRNLKPFIGSIRSKNNQARKTKGLPRLSKQNFATNFQVSRLPLPSCQPKKRVARTNFPISN